MSFLKKNIFVLAIITSFAFVLFSCASTAPSAKTETEGKAQESKKAQDEQIGKKEAEKESSKPERKRVATIPTFDFSGKTQRIELEDMYTEYFAFSYSEEFSNNFAGKLKSNVSLAKAEINLPAGSYEILAREKAEDSEHASFYIFVDNEPYLVSPSEPPLGSFENTTRTPVTFSLDADTKVLLTVQANSPHHMGQSGMMIDYLQIRKIQ